MIITIDGPAGSGKSTLAMMLAKHLDMFYLNSGFLYRGIAYVLITFYGYDEDRLHNPDIELVKRCIDQGDFRYTYENGLAKVYFQNKEITSFLKDMSISHATAVLAQNIDVRKIIRGYKRLLAQKYKNIVSEGRVLGSVVFPYADKKFYVTASEAVRAQRVQKLQAKRGKHISLEEVLEQVVARDQLDMNRVHDPLVKPDNAIELDTSNLSKDQMLEKALVYIKE